VCVCVCVCVGVFASVFCVSGQRLLNEVTFDLDIWLAS